MRVEANSPLVMPTIASRPCWTICCNPRRKISSTLVSRPASSRLEIPASREKQAPRIAQHYRLGGRAVLVLLKLQLAEIVVGLFACIRLGALQVLPEPERAVPGGRARMADPDAMPAKLGWLRTVTEPPATMASACMCIAKA